MLERKFMNYLIRITIFAAAVLSGFIANAIVEMRLSGNLSPVGVRTNGVESPGEIAKEPAPVREALADPEQRRMVSIDPEAEFSPRSSKKAPFRLLTIGTSFHGDEVSARSGEKWLGLFVANGRAEFRFAEVRVEIVRDSVVDKGPKNTGKSVSVKGNAEPVLMIEKASGLRPGSIEYFDGEYEGDSYDLVPGFKLDFDFGKGLVSLEVVEGSVNGGQVAAVVVRRGDQTQTLYMSETGGDSYLGRLYFVGDFDRDGWPDFYLSPNYHDNVNDRRLFLSSKSKKGKIVREFAAFTTVGC